MVNCSSWVSMSRKGVSSPWIRRAPKDPEPVKRWPDVSQEPSRAIAAMDFFTVVPRQSFVRMKNRATAFRLACAWV